jgi:hypothetical protein
MIFQNAENEYYLEDLTSTIKLDFTKMEQPSYHLLYTEGCHVVVEGELSLSNEQYFLVHVITMPPAEERFFTLKTLGISHCFSDEFRDQQLQQMMELEKIADDMLVVIISEIYLDKLIVFSKLEKMFSGFEENGIKPLYIFMGSFFSMNYYIMNNGKQIMKNAFSALADMICKYPMQREQAKFLFVPGNICLYIYIYIY